MRFLFGLLALFVFFNLGAACKQNAKKETAKPPSAAQEIPSTSAAATAVAPLDTSVTMKTGAGNTIRAKQLTTSGQDTEARFSQDGQRILFVSRLRPAHKQAQIYELHLGVMKEKRLTFHDGDDSSPSYTPDGQRFLFSSATDEIKEDPFVSERLMRTYLPDAYEARVKERGAAAIEGIEVYTQTLNGRTIDRLTRSPGFDGDPDVDAKGKRVLFSSARDTGYSHIYLLNSLLPGKTPVRLSEGKVADRGPRFSPDGKLAVWSRNEEKAPDTNVMIASANSSGDFKKARALTSGPGINFEPAWSPTGDEIIFSSNRDGKFYNLYVVDREGKCVRRFTDANFDQFQPAFSPDGKQVLFTGRRNSRHNIFIIEYQKPAPCPVPTAAPAPQPTAQPASPTPTTTPTGTANPTATPVLTPTPSPTPTPLQQ